MCTLDAIVPMLLLNASAAFVKWHRHAQLVYQVDSNLHHCKQVSSTAEALLQTVLLRASSM